MMLHLQLASLWDLRCKRLRERQRRGVMSMAARNRAAIAAASPAAYFERGQKNPRSPSPFVRGTT